MSLLNAVTPRDQPLTGVKRSLPSNPTTVPKNLPAFRGRDVGPGAAVKAPKLRQGNRDNEGTNVCVPYNRVMPLEFLSHYCGRVAPGDVAFLDKFHPGYVNSQPVNIGSAGTATMHRVLGVDGVNRMLHGATAPHGWVYKADAHSGIDTNLLAATSASEVIDGESGAFKLKALERYRMDGVVKSNDEPMNLTSNGARDATIFNIAVQGPTLVNNGYLAYDENPNATTVHSVTGRSRAVEAYPRGSQQQANHVAALGKVGSPWTAPGMYDFVAAFTGQYTPYPMQMFDRQLTTLDHIYVGLRAYELKGWNNSVQPVPMSAKQLRNQITSLKVRIGMAKKQGRTIRAQKTKKVLEDTEEELPKKLAERAEYDAVLKRIDGIMGLDTADKTAMKTKGTLADGRKLFFFQYMPMSSHKAMLLDLIDRLKNGQQTETSELELKKIERTHALYSKPHAIAGKFDEEDYDAIRKDDLKNMVGAWHVGRVLDTRAARHATYEQGPGDTGFMLNVDVHIEWHNALPQKAPNGAGGSNTYEEMMKNWSEIQYTSVYARERNQPNVDPSKVADWKTRCIQRGVDTGRSIRQSLQQKLGRLVGISTDGTESVVQSDKFALGNIDTMTQPQLSTVPWRAVSREAVAEMWAKMGFDSDGSYIRTLVATEIQDLGTAEPGFLKNQLLMTSTAALIKNLPSKPEISLSDLQTLLSGPLGTAAPLAADDPLHAAWMDLAAHRDDVDEAEGPMEVELGASAAATAAAAASAPTGGDSSLGSSWASLDSEPEPTAAAAALEPEPMAASMATPAPVEAPETAAALEPEPMPVEPEPTPVGPEPTPVITAAAAALAPVAHAAIDAAKQARAAKAKGKSKSPVRQKPTTAATAAAPVTSLLDTPVPPVTTQPTPTPAPAATPAAASASTATVSDLSLLGTAASKPAPQRRPRDTPSMTDSYFAFLDKDKATAPTSPTPSHSSDKSSESGGPKTFQRRPR